jgi:HTH-type transcriptional regulator / antitoxin HigA
LRDYEQRTEQQGDYRLQGVALIRGLLELHGLKQQELTPIFKTKSITSAVLNGKRRLMVEQIDGLAHFFGLPHSLFFEVRPENQQPIAPKRRLGESGG